MKQFKDGVISDLSDAVVLATQAMGTIPSAVSSMFATIKTTTASSSGGSSGSSLYINNATATKPDGTVVGININSSGKTTTSGLPTGTIVHTKGGDYKITGSTSSGYSSVKVTKKYASGTNNTISGLVKMGEKEDELFISASGRLIPITTPVIGNIAGGGAVFNAEQMKNVKALWDLSNLKLGNMNSAAIGSKPQQVNNNSDNRIIINGMTVDSGSADGQALISALRRYVGNH